MLTGTKKELLSRLFYTLSEPTSYGSGPALYLAAKARNSSISRADVETFLRSQDAFLAFRESDKKPRGRSREYSRYVEKHPDGAWSCDLAYVKHSRFKLLLTCADVVSNKIFARVQRNKRSGTTARNLRRLIDEQNDGKPPKKLWLDRGGEWSQLKNEFPNVKIAHSIPRLRQHAFRAERAHRSVKEKLERVSYARGRKLDISTVLPDILSSLNHSVQRKVGLSAEQIRLQPGVAFEKKFGAYLRRQERARADYFLNQTEKGKRRKNILEVNTPVKVALVPGSVFHKGTKPKFTKETFYVDSVVIGAPVKYIIRDAEGEKLSGLLYRRQLYPVAVTD